MIVGGVNANTPWWGTLSVVVNVPTAPSPDQLTTYSIGVEGENMGMTVTGSSEKGSILDHLSPALIRA